MTGWIHLFSKIAGLFAFLKMNIASREKEECGSDPVFLLCGTSDSEIVQHPLFLKLQLVKSILHFHPQQNQFDASEFLNLQDGLVLVDLLGDFVPSNVFPVKDAQSSEMLKKHENILRFAIYYFDEFLIALLAEKFFGMINRETRDDFLRLIYNCKRSDRDSANVLRIFFHKQAELVIQLGSKEQGLFLSTFSGLVPADVNLFKQFALQRVKCFHLKDDESTWTIDGHEFILGNGYYSEEWQLEIQNGNPHLEIALHLIQPIQDPRVFEASSFLQFLSITREGLREKSQLYHVKNAIRFALDFGWFDLVIDWCDMVESQNLSAFEMYITMLQKGIKQNNLQYTRFASDKLKDCLFPSKFYKTVYDPILNAIQVNCDILIFEEIFPFAQQIVTPQDNSKQITWKNHLEEAIEFGRSDIALSLIDKGANPNQLCEREVSYFLGTKSVLRLAAEKSMTEVMLKLLSKGAKVSSSVLFFGFQSIPILEILLDFLDSNTSLDKILKSAVLNGNLEAVKYLESRGARFTFNSNISSSKSGSTLSDEFQIVKQLAELGKGDILIHFLEREAKLTTNQLEEIWSSLLLSVIRNFEDRGDYDQWSIPIMNYLHERNPKYFPENAIEKSFRNSPFEILEWLLNAFGDSFLALSPLHSLLAVKRTKEVRQILMMKPKEIHTHNSIDQSLFSISTKPDWLYDLEFDSSSLPDDSLLIALRDSRFKDFQRLFREGARLDFVNESQQTVLHIAASIKDIETLSFIRENFASFDSLVNEIDSKANTCLHYAVQNESASHPLVAVDQGENISFITLLAQRIEDIQMKNIYGKSPLKMALNQFIHDQLVNAAEIYRPPRSTEINK